YCWMRMYTPITRIGSRRFKHGGRHVKKRTTETVRKDWCVRDLADDFQGSYLPTPRLLRRRPFGQCGLYGLLVALADDCERHFVAHLLIAIEVSGELVDARNRLAVVCSNHVAAGGERSALIGLTPW